MNHPSRGSVEGKVVVTITAGAIQALGLWDRFCEKRGINPYAINEGLMSEDEVFTIYDSELPR
jgi:hypothetical protein